MPLQQRDYTARHATILSVVALTCATAWIGYCVAIGLPFHPWSSGALAVAVLAVCFFFSGLDPLAVTLTTSLHGTWSIFVFICVGLAAVFSPIGEAFPLWALIPLLMCGGAMACVVILFGIRSILRVILGRPLE